VKGKRQIWFLLCFLQASFLSAQVLDTICVEGNRQSNLAVTYTEGATYTWLIRGGTIVSKADSNDVTVNWGNTAGIYPITVYVTNAMGCSGDTSLAYIYLVLPSTARIVGPDKVCPGEMVTLRAVAGGDHTWQGGKTLEEINFVAHRDTAVYLVALNGKCTNDTTYHRIEVEETPYVNFDGPNDTVPVRSFQDFVYIGDEVSDVSWVYDGAYVSSDQLYTHQFMQAGIYKIGVVAHFGNCTDTLYRKYYVFDDFAVHIPNAFTANNDGVNDRFLFRGVGIKSYNAQVYNRWGQRLYSWTDKTPEPGWDGTLKPGEEAPLGTYLYKIFVQDYYGIEHTYSGYFSLLR
jgi:gliding motility-associated-like protein